MKVKKFEKSLNLGKVTVATLGEAVMNDVRGGVSEYPCVKTAWVGCSEITCTPYTMQKTCRPTCDTYLCG